MSDQYLAALSLAVVLIGFGGLSSCVAILKLQRRVDRLEHSIRMNNARY